MYILYPYALDHPKSKSIPFLKIKYVATFLKSQRGSIHTINRLFNVLSR